MVSPRPCPTLSNSSRLGNLDVRQFQRILRCRGRNGYLSGLHQANRGFTEQTLKVLTVIHNFDLRRDDGTTAAQRLFGKPFPVLFDWVVLHMGELPRPRRTLKLQSQKPTTCCPGLSCYPKMDCYGALPVSGAVGYGRDWKICFVSTLCRTTTG
jgi:hypothetical protein